MNLISRITYPLYAKKINNQFSVFKRFGKLISSEIMLRLYKVFILPHFHYCSMIWHFCNSEDSVKLDTLRAILQESEAKLEMKIFNPSSIFVWIGRCIVAMVTTLDHVGQTSMFWPKNSLSRSKNKGVWFSGAREPIQMKFIQMVEPLSQFIKIAVKKFWVL